MGEGAGADFQAQRERERGHRRFNLWMGLILGASAAAAAVQRVGAAEGTVWQFVLACLAWPISFFAATFGTAILGVLLVGVLLFAMVGLQNLWSGTRRLIGRGSSRS